MTLQKISFEHFYIETADVIDKKFAVLINPNQMAFYKVGNIYLSLTSDNGILMVNFAINTGKAARGNWVDCLIQEAKKNKYNRIVFVTAEDNYIVQNIAKKYDCELVETWKSYYIDGKDAYVYSGDPSKF